jgi:hypothetical protein
MVNRKVFKSPYSCIQFVSAPQDGHFSYEYTSQAHFGTIADYVRVLVDPSHLIMQDQILHSANTVVSATL